MDLIDEDQVDFQLKIHTLQNMLASKQGQINYYERKISLIASNSINDQSKIFTLISEVKQTVLNIESFFNELKNIFHELNMASILTFFKNVSYCLIGSLRLLADGFQCGVEQNMIKFSQSRQQNLQTETFGAKVSQEQIIRQLQINSRRGNQFYSDIRTKMEIDQIYKNVMLQKHAVQRLSCSLASSKLYQIEKYFDIMSTKAEDLIEQIYVKRNNQIKQSQADKIQTPDALDRIFKAKMSDSMKQCFMEGIQKITKKIQKEFYEQQYNKIRQQILKLKITTSTCSTQTIRPEEQTKQKESQTAAAIKYKKIIQKLKKQIRDLQQDQQALVEKYLNIFKENQAATKQENLTVNKKKNDSEIPLHLRESIVKKSKQKRQSVNRLKLKRQSIFMVDNLNQQLSQTIDNTDTSKLNIEYTPRMSKLREKKGLKMTINKTKFYGQNHQHQVKRHNSRQSKQNMHAMNCNQSFLSVGNKQQDVCAELKIDQIQNNSKLYSKKLLAKSQKMEMTNMELQNDNSSENSLFSQILCSNDIDVCIELQKEKSENYQTKYNEIVSKIIKIVQQTQMKQYPNLLDVENMTQNLDIQGLFNDALLHMVTDPSANIRLMSAPHQQVKNLNNHKNQKIKLENSDKSNNNQSIPSKGTYFQKSKLDNNLVKIFFKISGANNQYYSNTKQKNHNRKPEMHHITKNANKLNRYDYATKVINNNKRDNRVRNQQYTQQSLATEIQLDKQQLKAPKETALQKCNFNNSFRSRENKKFSTFQHILKATKKTNRMPMNNEQIVARKQKSNNNNNKMKGRFDKFTGDLLMLRKQENILNQQCKTLSALNRRNADKKDVQQSTLYKQLMQQRICNVIKYKQSSKHLLKINSLSSRSDNRQDIFSMQRIASAILDVIENCVGSKVTQTDLIKCLENILGDGTYIKSGTNKHNLEVRL